MDIVSASELQRLKEQARTAEHYARKFEKKVADLKLLDPENKFAIDSFSESVNEEWSLASEIWHDLTILTTGNSPLGMISRIRTVICAKNAGRIDLAKRILEKLLTHNLIDKSLGIEMCRSLNIDCYDDFGEYKWSM